MPRGVEDAGAALRRTPTRLLQEQIRVQTEYLFSSTNLSKDAPLRALMDQDASRQGACDLRAVMRCSGRLRKLVDELGARECGGGEAGLLRSFAAALRPSPMLVLNDNTGTVKRHVSLEAAPPLFDPEARPPPPPDEEEIGEEGPRQM